MDKSIRIEKSTELQMRPGKTYANVFECTVSQKNINFETDSSSSRNIPFKRVDSVVTCLTAKKIPGSDGFAG